MMTTVEVVLQLADDVARRAREAGLLQAERIAELIEREVAGDRSVEPASVEPLLRPQNRRLLDFLAAWMAEPDDLGHDWWDKFEADMVANRFTIADSG